ncbi:hypothetical protein [Parasphingorhabdus sp. NYA22]
MLREEIFNLQAQLASAEQAHKHGAEYADRTAERLQLLEAVLDIVPVGVVVTDNDGKIFMGNSQIEIMLKHPVFHSASADNYGEWVSFHKDGRKVESNEYPLSKIIRDGEEAAEIEVLYQRGDDTKFWVRIIGKAVTDAKGIRIHGRQDDRSRQRRQYHPLLASCQRYAHGRSRSGSRQDGCELVQGGVN